MRKGKVWKYGDEINTDVIFPGKYTYSILEPEEMARHALEDLDPEFAQEVRPGDILVAGKNFGCGSSREQAATCLKFAGVQAIIAKSFARIFFRNAINQGLPVIQCSQAVDDIKNGEEITINFSEGRIETKRDVFDFAPLPEYILEILESGGLIPYIKNKIESQKKPS
ncbi:MAG: 3-isopropylmalate dehydratase small subunit [Candidatus Aminicenantes bacterium]|nr:3-isopropylmalate dehydratase small subunit [Candidatus Aminicenantes bacterium]MDH5383741.1 3-isopropylmalate dehydratase small subunit [Candidatus Aminicenantes bacterium]MDH5741957.1 3-isopropylmalate dehydratase small subunit [Candidatus Aminicenantes bacterium]